MEFYFIGKNLIIFICMMQFRKLLESKTAYKSHTAYIYEFAVRSFLFACKIFYRNRHLCEKHNKKMSLKCIFPASHTESIMLITSIPLLLHTTYIIRIFFWFSAHLHK